MDKFKRLIAERHEYARNWKARTGGQVVGWYEPYFPEELAYAAGMLPVRLLAGKVDVCRLLSRQGHSQPVSEGTL